MRTEQRLTRIEAKVDLIVENQRISERLAIVEQKLDAWLAGSDRMSAEDKAELNRRLDQVGDNLETAQKPTA